MGSRTRLDRVVFLIAVLLLTCLGIVAIHTSSITTRQPGFEAIYLSKHLANVGVAIAVMLWAGTRRQQFWTAYPMLVGLLAVGSLTYVLVPGFGLSSGGATRWIRLPGFTAQPSEWAKLAIPILVIMALRPAGERRKTGGLSRRFFSRESVGRGLLLAMAGACVVLTLKQPDLGTSLLLAGSAVMAAWLIGAKAGYFLIGGAVAIPAAAFVSLRGYQWRRIMGLVDTWRDWHEAPYQLKQSLIALGEGGTYGVGLGRGWQKLSFLPESHTDFVVAVIGEELGLAGIAFVAACWTALLVSGLSMLSRVTTPEPKAIATALLSMLVLQAALNVGVATAVVPPTGIPHPFLSYGGNSILVTAAALGITWSVSSPTDRETVSSSDGIGHGVDGTRFDDDLLVDDGLDEELAA